MSSVMNNETVVLLEKHFDTAFAAPDGIKKLRELILTLAMQGKLVPQDPTDRPASELLKAIELEKQNLITGNSKKTKSLPSIKPEEKPFELPDSWQWARFGDLVQVINGKAYKQNELLDVGTPVLRVGNLFTSKHWYYSNLLLEEDKRITTGDLIYAWSASFGPFIWNGGEVIYHYHIWKLKFFLSDIPEKKYLYNYLLEATEKIKASGNGIAMIHMTKERMEKLLVPVPPLEEQHRIVAKIEQLMARCDELEKLGTDRTQKRTNVHTAAIDRLLTAKADIDFNTAWNFITQHFSELYSVKENVIELRKVILQLAVMGKLVPQDPNEEPASVLANSLKSKRKSIAEKVKKSSTSQASNVLENVPFHIPSNWIWQRIKDLYEVSGGIQKTPHRTPVSNFSPYLRVANVQRGRLNLDQIEHFELFDGELDRWRLQSGDLLVVEGNGSEKEIGRCAIWNGEIENCVHQNHIIRMRPIDHSGQSFTLVFLNSPTGMAEMKRLAITTSGLYSLSVGKIREILIPLPPLAEQHRIVAKIERLMEFCDRLEESIEAAKTKQTELLNALMSQV